MSKIVGETVIVHQMLGVVMGWSEEEGCEHMLRVHLYDTDLEDYKERNVVRSDLTVIDNPLVLQRLNKEDLESRRAYLHESLDIALWSQDKAWFQEVTDELKALDDVRVKLGSIVTDNRGKMHGIVITEPDANDCVDVIAWDKTFRNYLEFPKRIDTIRVVTDPVKLAEINAAINKSDRLADEWNRILAAELALDTQDKTWFDKTVRKETSDGA